MTITFPHQNEFASATRASGQNLAAAAALASGHPDADIITAAADFETLEFHIHDLIMAIVESEDKFPGPSAPEAMFVRPEDPRSLKPNQCHDKRWWYRGAIDDLRSKPLTRRAVTDDQETIYIPDPKAQARADEIVAAFDKWEDDRARDHVACGRAALEAAIKTATPRAAELRTFLLATQSRTMDGIQAKARCSRAVETTQGDGEDEGWDLDLARSVVADILRLADVQA